MSRIKIVCTAPAHPTKKAIVRRFHYVANLGWAVEEIEGPRPRYRLVGQSLGSDSRPVSAGVPVDRERYRLNCDLCGEVVEVRDEKLYAVFDKLRDHLPGSGYFTITLAMLRRALAAIV
jgi:hypothetical protein